MSGFADFERYDAVGLADLVRRGKVTPADLLDAAIDRVEARNPVVNAVVIKLYDYGRRAIADGLPDGPLRGVPFLVKDLTASIAGVPMTRGSKFFAGSPPPARNTMAPYLGEGLGGRSAEHAVTLTVRDSAALLDATAGAAPGDPYAAPPQARTFREEVGADPGALRIAFTSLAPNGAKVEAESSRVLVETAKLCADLGHRVEEADPEVDRAAVVPTFMTIVAANTVVNLGTHPTAGRPPRPDEVERITWGTAKLGEKVSGADYVRAIQTAHRLGRQMAAFHARWDVLLTPGLATLPPKLGWIDMMMDDVDEYWRRVFAFSPFTVWFNLTGQPAIVLPVGRSGTGLPVAVQLVARAGDEGILFRLASRLETARPWLDRRPALAA